ncbi:MAG: holo-ACP synthase [Candidatus Krumholzibacteriia bacterium]
MILGLGTDVVEVARIAGLVARHGARFLDRCFRPGEQELARRRGRGGAAALAARWAAREAFLKALGGDVQGIPYRDIEVVRAATGAPALRLHGRAAAALAARGGRRVHVALSHERAYAVATVVIED